MGCGGSSAASAEEPTVAQGVAAAVKEHNKMISPFQSREKKTAQAMEQLMAMSGDPRMQALQTQAMEQQMNNPAMAAQMQQMQQMMGGGMASQPVPVGAAVVATVMPEDDVPARIMKLKSLLDAGAISQADYDVKKDELLKGM